MKVSDRQLDALVRAVLRTPTARTWSALLRAGGLSSRLVDDIVAELRPAALAVPRAMGSIKSVTSRLGGAPDVARGFRWPRWRGESLAFLGQLRLRELPASVREDLALPGDGLLSFFYATGEQPWGITRSDRGGARIYFWPTEEPLVRAKPPADVPREVKVPSHRLRFVETGTVPDAWSLWALYRDVGPRTEPRWLQAIARWPDARPEPRHQVGGHVGRAQRDYVELDCAMFAAGIDRGKLDLRTRRARLALEDAETWTLLFLVDSDLRRDMCWGDAGALNFWMRRADLASLRFERAWCTLGST